MRLTHLILGVALVAAVAFSGCRSEEQVSQNDTNNAAASSAATLTLPSGTSIAVSLATSLTSKTANVGDAWTGSVENATVLDGHNIIPAGSSVTGTVTAVTPARKGDRAMLDLGMTSITVANHTYKVHGNMASITAGSTRARNLGAIAGSAAGGALIGKAATGTGKGALIGGIVGGGVATGVVAASDGYQVTIEPGTSCTFTTSEAVAVRL
jgi:hypothetical protein